MITVKVIKEGYGHKPGQVLKLTEFDAGILMAFGYAENYIEPKIETQMVSPPEVRVKTFVDKRQEPIKLIVEPELLKEQVEEKPVDTGGYFKRTYRRKKK